MTKQEALNLLDEYIFVDENPDSYYFPLERKANRRRRKTRHDKERTHFLMKTQEKFRIVQILNEVIINTSDEATINRLTRRKEDLLNTIEKRGGVATKFRSKKVPKKTSSSRPKIREYREVVVIAEPAGDIVHAIPLL